MTPEQARARRKRLARINMHALQMPPPPLAVTAPSGVQVQALPHFDRALIHPETGLEPNQVVSIYRSAECGWTLHQAELFTGIVENDGHLRATIEGRINAVAGKQWQVLPGGDDDESRNAALLLDSALKESNFSEVLPHILSARYMGWSGVEIFWDERNDLIQPLWFIDVHARRFSFNSLDLPELVNNASNTSQPLEPGKWLFPRVRGVFGGVTARAGLMRTATWYALFKKWSWRDWVIYAEKFGIPLVLGRYKMGATEDEKSTLEGAVEDIGEAGQATMSEETNVEIHEAQRGGDSNGLHRSIVREANEEISKLITGSTLTMQTGGNGSFAQAEVHANTSFAHVEADAALVNRTLTTQLFRPFLQWNGFLRAKTPRLVIHIAKETDGLSRAQEFQAAQDMGLEIDAEQLREELHFRAPPTPDRVLRKVESSEGSPFNVIDTE